MARVSTTNMADLGDFYYHYPKLAVVVTARYAGSDNAMAAAWHSPLSRVPPLYGVAISPKRLTYDLIIRSHEFGINFLPFEKVELVVGVGTAKGRETDKFSAFHIGRKKGVRTGVPILDDAYVAYECRLVTHYACGDHEWVVGEIVALHLEKDAFMEKGMLDLSRVKPVLYMARDHYATASPESLRFVKMQS